MFGFVWRAFAGPRNLSKKRARNWARPGVELLEDRRLLSSAAPVISHLSNNNWTEGLASFNGTMTITGGKAPYSLVSDANLPAGVTPVVTGDQIAFTGTPDVAKDFTDCQITIKDADGLEASKTFIIDVTPALTLGNLSLNQWTVNQPGFVGAITISGGTGSYSLASSSGLPTGLSAVVSGNTVKFTGTPTATGAFSNATITVADADGATATETFTMTISAPPTLGQLTDLQWTAGMPNYDGTVTITGGTAPYTITAFAYLPFSPVIDGNTIYFSGTAPARIYYGATFTITDRAGASATETNNITVNEQVSVGALTNSTWTVGQQNYNGTITLAYGSEPFTISGYTGLPTGLTPTITGDTIAFTGTPTSVGTFGNGDITLEDSGGQYLNIPIAITIRPQISFTTTALPVAGDGVGYKGGLHATGGTGTPTFALTGGSLPSGLVLRSNGNIVGATTASGVFAFTATATDAAGDQTSATFQLSVGPAFSLGDPSQAQWTVGQGNFTSTIAVKGGVGPFTLESATGLPAGLSASLVNRTIDITGTPTTEGAFANAAITITAADGYTDTLNFTITINRAPTLGTLAAVPWTAGQSGYPSTIAISGGTGPYAIVSTSGLPFMAVVNGNSIRFIGAASAGTYGNGVIKLRDAAGAVVTADLPTIVINAQPVVSHMSTNNWTEATADFIGTMTISGGTGPFTIETTRNIPFGLTPVINGDMIEFTGTPEIAGLFENCSVTIRDAAGAIYDKIFLLDIAPPLMLGTLHLPVWKSGVPYSVNLATSGGTGALTFTLTAGSLPPGLTLSPRGKISGTATATGTFTFTITVTDAIGDKSSETYTL